MTGYAPAWTEKEDETIRLMTRDGYPAGEIAKVLPLRSVEAIRARLGRMGGIRAIRAEKFRPHSDDPMFDIRTYDPRLFVRREQDFEHISDPVGRVMADLKERLK